VWLDATSPCAGQDTSTAKVKVVRKDGQPRCQVPPSRLQLPLETSMPGVFAAGDVRLVSVKRVASTVGEGSVAAAQMHRYVQVQVLWSPLRLGVGETRGLGGGEAPGLGGGTVAS
jgi:NADPH-dependent glutamate synthase beta subunit-like oxidoreductase